MTGPRDAAAVRVFPPGVPLLAVVAALGLDRLWPLAPGIEVPAPACYPPGAFGSLAVHSVPRR